MAKKKALRRKPERKTTTRKAVSVPPGPSYDAPYMLGIGSKSPVPLPAAAAEEMIVRWPGGSLKTLLELPGIIDDKLFRGDPRWCKKFSWYDTPLLAAMYRVRLPIPQSGDKDARQQRQCLYGDERHTPVVLILACCICDYLTIGKHRIADLQIRCPEPADPATSIIVEIKEDQLFVDQNACENHDSHIQISGYRIASTV